MKVKLLPLSTMTFMMKKKKFKFLVDFCLIDLNNVPLVNAVLFAKVRLADGGGSFRELSPRVNVVNHHVRWNKSFQFSCRVSSSLQTGVLEQRICRVSIRKEVKGGRSFQKLGFCDINLSEFAGSGVTGMTRSYLLEGYDSGHQRQDNSILTINVTMTLQSSDPFFKVPQNIGYLRSNGTSAPSSAEALKILNPSDRRAPISDVKLEKNVPSDDLCTFSGENAGKSSKNNILANRSSVLPITVNIADDDDPGSTATSVSTLNACSSSIPHMSVLDAPSSLVPALGSSGHAATSAASRHSTPIAANSNAAAAGRQPSAGAEVAVTASNTTKTTAAMLTPQSAQGPATISGIHSAYYRHQPSSSLNKRIRSFESQLGCAHYGSNSRMDETRVDANKLIDNLIKNIDLRSTSPISQTSEPIGNIATTMNNNAAHFGDVDLSIIDRSPSQNKIAALRAFGSNGSMSLDTVGLSVVNQQHQHNVNIVVPSISLDPSSTSSIGTGITNHPSMVTFGTFPKRARDYR